MLLIDNVIAKGNKMTNYLKQSEGKVVSMWEGKNSTYWCLVQYWIGTGYQYVERQCSQEAYEVWNL